MDKDFTVNLTQLTKNAPNKAIDPAIIVTLSVFLGSIIIYTPIKPKKVKIILKKPGFSPKNIIAKEPKIIFL